MDIKKSLNNISNRFIFVNTCIQVLLMKHGITSSLTSSLARSICPKQSDIMKTSFCLCIETVWSQMDEGSP